MATKTRRKTAREKLETVHAGHGKLEPVPPIWQVRMGKGTMLIPRPLDVDAAMRAVARGKLLTMGKLRAKLAADAGATTTCPLTTGIFARLAAEAAEEDREAGKARLTPWWRTIKDDGKLNEKFPGGVKRQAELLKAEGHEIVKGRSASVLRVAGFDG